MNADIRLTRLTALAYTLSEAASWARPL